MFYSHDNPALSANKADFQYELPQPISGPHAERTRLACMGAVLGAVVADAAAMSCQWVGQAFIPKRASYSFGSLDLRCFCH